MSSSVDLLIRADAGEAIGGGHVMRCLALAQAALRRGGRVTLLTQSESSHYWPRWTDAGAHVEVLTADVASASDAETTAQLARECAAHTVVIDGYPFGVRYREALQEARAANEHPFSLLVIDDLGGVDLAAGDFLLNQALDVPREHYGAEGEVMLGPRFALLRDEFLDQPVPARASSRVNHLLITLGASDPGDISSRVLAALAHARPAAERPAELTLVIGPDNAHAARLRARAADLGLTVEFTMSPRNMAPLIARADAAVSAAGSTVWELALSGCPSVLVAVADNQRRNASSLARRGAALATALDDAGDEELVDELRRLLGEGELRAALAARSRELVDGRGRERVLDALAASRKRA